MGCQSVTHKDAEIPRENPHGQAHSRALNQSHDLGAQGNTEPTEAIGQAMKPKSSGKLFSVNGVTTLILKLRASKMFGCSPECTVGR